jgi:hypothetical protein
MVATARQYSDSSEFEPQMSFEMSTWMSVGPQGVGAGITARPSPAAARVSGIAR